MQRSLIRLFRFLPLWLLYGFMAMVIPFYVLLDGRARRASWQLFRRRLGYKPLPSAWHVYLNMFSMGQVVLDRFAAYAGKPFRVEDATVSLFRQLCESSRGAVLLSAHVGSFEMTGYMLTAGKPLSVLVYGGETATVMQNRSRMFGLRGVSMVPVSDDLSHLYTLSGALSRGELVSLPSDRIFGSPKRVRCPFLGAEASFPAGPFSLALSREVPAVAVFCLKTGYRSYRLHLEELPVPPGSRREQVQAMARSYSLALEKTVRACPDQWFNFYDFWADEAN